jgi:hypothetical protein
MSLPLHLRTYQEPTKQDQSRLFFNVPTLESLLQGGTGEAKEPVLVKSSALRDGVREKEARGDAMGWQEMEIGAVLSVEGKDEVYVRPRKRGIKAIMTADPLYQSGKLSLLPPFLCFISLDKRSARFTLPLYTIRRVERLNSRAGVFALSLATWHGMRVVRPSLSHFPLYKSC